MRFPVPLELAEVLEKQCVLVAPAVEVVVAVLTTLCDLSHIRHRLLYLYLLRQRLLILLPVVPPVGYALGDEV